MRRRGTNYWGQGFPAEMTKVEARLDRNDRVRKGSGFILRRNFPNVDAGRMSRTSTSVTENTEVVDVVVRYL